MIGTYDGPDTEDEDEEEVGKASQSRGLGAETKRDGASVAANDKPSDGAASKRATNGYDSDEIYDMDTESEDDD